jgi:hypothetical protein
MKNNLLFVLFFILNFLQLKAQRETIQTFDASSIKEVIIEVDEVFNVEIETANTPVIKLSTLSEGEYLNEIVIQTQQDLHSFQLNSQYREILTSGFDKLSAHKVYAVHLKLVIPKNLNVIVISNIASLNAVGNFKKLEAELKSGACRLIDFSGQALINTFQGNVYVETTTANVKATTNHGNLQIDEKLSFGSLIEIKSIYGDVEVRKAE